MKNQPQIKTLVVDDELVVTTLASAVAENVIKGKVDTVHTAEDAKTLWLEENHNLIILDLHLPGMSGEEFCRWLRDHPKGKDTFVLVCTGDSKPETFRNVLNLGANDYIIKPLEPTVLSIRIEIARHTILESLKRLELQEELARNEKRFRLISENSRDLVCTHTPDGTLTYVSPSCKNLLGLDAAELVGKNFDLVKVNANDQPINLNATEDALNGQLESTYIWQAQHKSGKTVWLETFSQASRNDEEEINEVYSYSRDVTDQKNEEAQLRMLSIVGEETDTAGFLNTMIHEMEESFNGSVMIHIHGKPGEYETYRLPQKRLDAAVEQFHKDLDRNTSHEKPQFQGMGASSVFHHIKGSEEYEAVITQPVLDNFGRPIGKITIARKSAIPESERTKAVLLLCGTRVGSVLEEHLTR